MKEAVLNKFKQDHNQCIAEGKRPFIMIRGCVVESQFVIDLYDRKIEKCGDSGLKFFRKKVN